MAFIEGNFPPLKVWVRDEYMFQMASEKVGQFHRGIITSIRCLPGQVVLFQVLLENGVMRDKLPCSALLLEPELPSPDLPFHFLQIWNCFSHNFTVFTNSYVYDTRVSVFMKDKKWYDGSYFTTINWGCGENDYTLAEDPEEHKSHHVVLLDNGQIAIQPNNRMQWGEPSFVTKPFPTNPEYKVNTEYWNAEGYEKWATEDSDKYLYDTQN